MGAARTWTPAAPALLARAHASTAADVDALVEALPPSSTGPAGPSCGEAARRAVGRRRLAVAAALAVDAGHDVTAVHLPCRAPATLRTGSRGCCSKEDARDAGRVADVLGIPSSTSGTSPSASARTSSTTSSPSTPPGRTPNPCLRCNEKIKFAAVLDRALALGFDAVVTGHHARLADGVLRRSVDAAKDQSYVLAVLTPEQLAGTVLPLGAMTKAQVRELAAAKGARRADKADSHDVCFIADGDTAGFLRQRLGAQPGPVVDALTGAVVGRHDGAYAFTVGTAPRTRPHRSCAGRPPPLRPRPRAGLRTVTVGPRSALDVREVRADRPRELATADLPADCEVQLQAHGRPPPPAR
jgi:tRNA-specific 2-thiouridylase